MKKRTIRREKKFYSKTDKAITLIALVITIIVMLILAGVTISYTTGNDGVIKKTKSAVELTRGSHVKEYVDLASLENMESLYLGENEKTRTEVIAELQKQGNLKEDEVKLLETQDKITIGGIEIDFSVLKDESKENIPIPTITSITETAANDYLSAVINVKIGNSSSFDSINITLSPDNKSISSDNANFTITKCGTYTATVTGTKNGKKSESATSKITVTNVGYIPGSKILRANAPILRNQNEEYADIDGDGVADGIIVADLTKDSSDTSAYGTYTEDFSYTKLTSNIKGYSYNKDYKYINSDGTEVAGTLVTCTNNTGSSRYYIISLADFDSKGHYWYYNAGENLDLKMDPNTNTFGLGSQLTQYNIEKWKAKAYGEQNSNDIWGLISEKQSEGWFVPSGSECMAFSSYLQARNTTHGSYQPIINTWTSQQCGEFYEPMSFTKKHNCGAIAYDESEGCGGSLTNEEGPLRLAAQF